jgi:signal transduction histidine kinase
VLEELAVPSPIEVPACGAGECLVLIVEDNPEMNRHLRETLAQRYRVDSAFDGRDGLSKALANKPDLILTDLIMPGMNGEQLVHEIRRRQELDNVPILLLTARTDDELKLRLLRQGAQDYLTKPCSVEELRARVGNLLEMKRIRDILQAELETRNADLESLARQLTLRTREAKTALASVEVAREHAERASRMKSDFLGMVSHELRTPVTALQLHLQQLHRNQETALSEKQRKLVRRMSGSTGRLIDLIQSLLHYTTIQTGQVTSDLTSCNVGEIAAAAVEEVRPQADEKGLAVQLSIPYDLGPLTSDPLLLRLIVVNLLVNAVKFTDHGFVELEIEQTESNHQIKVRDTGPGIAPENRARVFEPFEQLEPIRKKHLPGIGLGLALVREMAVSLGGRVQLESEPGSGSTFTVVLPSSVECAGMARVN